MVEPGAGEGVGHLCRELADADHHAQALHELLGEDYPVATTTLPNSLAELVAVRRTIDFDIDLGGAILFGHGIRHPINRLHLDVQAVDDEARQRLAEAYGADRICVADTGGPALDDPPGGGVPGAIALPDTDVANFEAALLAEVTLRGDRDLDGGCVWVEDDDGTPLNIIWPPKYAVLFHDDGGFELLDHQGTTVAHDGDRLEMGGGWHERHTGTLRHRRRRHRRRLVHRRLRDRRRLLTRPADRAPAIHTRRAAIEPSPLS